MIWLGRPWYESAPVDNRLNAVRNIIFCEAWKVPGLCNRFVEEVKSAARDLASTYGSFKACVDQMHITNTRILKEYYLDRYRF